jgi:uncharacterized membrane protein YdjX (TVP38/TMEM64 family)
MKGEAGLTQNGSAPFWRLAGLFLALAALFAVPFLLWGERFDILLDQHRLRGWFAGFRSTAWLVAIALLVSDLLLPIPNTIVMAALGVIYGPLLGGLVATVGNCLSGLLGYVIGRRFGRPLARRLLGDAELGAAEHLFTRSGGWIVAGSRWLPILPEAIACMAGLARMPAPRFALALLCGSAPLGFVVAGVGHAGSGHPLLTIALCALLPLPVWYLLRRTTLNEP